MSPSREMSTIAAVVRFVAACLVAAAVISAGAYWVVSRNAISEAIRNAQEIAAIDGRNIAAPAMTEGVVNADPAALDTFDRLIHDRVLSPRVVRVKIWAPSGRIVYSDVRQLVGEAFDLGPDERAAIRGNRVAAEVSELDRPENRFERAYGKLLEVYLPITSQSGETFLFETYQVYASIDQDQQRIWSAFFPVLIGGLLLLLAVEVPLAWSLASSVQRERREREELLARSLRVSVEERRRIASDLHDGVVQMLAGTALSLGSDRARRDPAGVMAEAALVIRQAVRDLRTLIVDIAPPNLAGDRLESALQDLLTPLAARGLETALAVEGLDDVDTATGNVLYRAAQEAIRNAQAHAAATEIKVRVEARPGRAELEVRDNGRGFTAEEVLSRRREGHVGLSLLRDLIEDSGGELTIQSVPGQGTTLRVAVQPAAR